MLAVRKVLESTAANAVCVLGLESHYQRKAWDSSASGAVVIAAIAESIHVFDIVRTTTSSPSTAALPFRFCPRGHVFNVGCGVAGLVALSNQCIFIWTRDQECIFVRYQANLKPPPSQEMMADNSKVYSDDGQPSPVYNKEHHWYVIRRTRLWCPDESPPLPLPEIGVNEGMDTVHIRFTENHIFIFTIKWAKPCAFGARNSASTDSLRISRWHSEEPMSVYAGTGFQYPTQSCSVALRRSHESPAEHQVRLERLWRRCSPYSNVADEDLIGYYSVGDLSKHKNVEALHNTSKEGSPNRRPSDSAAAAHTVHCSGVDGIWLARQLYSAQSPLMPCPAVGCGYPQGGFVNVRGTGGSASVHRSAPTLTDSKSFVITGLPMSSYRHAIAVVIGETVGRSEVEWLTLVFLTTDSCTAVYRLQRRFAPVGSHHLVLDGLVYGGEAPRQVLLCTHSGHAINDVWVALENGRVSRLSVPALRSRWNAKTDQNTMQEDGGWPLTGIVGLPPTFRCRRMIPADHLFPAFQKHDRTSILDPMVYPCTDCYAILSDSVQDAYVVDLIERRVVAALTGDGPMTDLCEASHGYVASFAKGVLRYLQPGAPLYVRGVTKMRAPIKSLLTARIPQVGHSDGRNVEERLKPGLYIMVSSSSTSQLFHFEMCRMTFCEPDKWPYLCDEATLAFGAGPAGPAQCTATRFSVGYEIGVFPCPVSHATSVVLSDGELVFICTLEDRSDGTTELLVVGMNCSLCRVSLPNVSVWPASCIAATAAGCGSKMSVLVGRWDGGVTTGFLQQDAQARWRCVGARTIFSALGAGAPVRQLLPLPSAEMLLRWVASHTDGAVSIIVIDARESPGVDADGSVGRHTWTLATLPGVDRIPLSGAFLAPVARAEGDGVLNGFDGALLQPFCGSAVFFSAALTGEDTMPPSQVSLQRFSDAKVDAAWPTHLENSVRALLEFEDAQHVQARAWSGTALVVEHITSYGTLMYDLLVVQHMKIHLLTLDDHLFTRRQSNATPMRPDTRAYMLAPGAPARYICARRVVLPPSPTSTSEALISIAGQPDGEKEEMTMCATVSTGGENESKLTVLRTATLDTLDSLALPNCTVQWLAGVPPFTATSGRPTPMFLLCSVHESPADVRLSLVSGNPLRVLSQVVLEPLPTGSVEEEEDGEGETFFNVDGAVGVVPRRERDGGEISRAEVLVALAVDISLHLFALRNYKLYFQHCVFLPSCTASVGFCYPVLSVCTQGDTNVYLQVYPVHDTTEMLAPSYTHYSTRLLKDYGKVSWKMRVEAREPSAGACVLAQTALHDRCVRADIEGNVSLLCSFFGPYLSSSRARTTAQGNGDDVFVGAADGPQSFLTHAFRLPSAPTKARFLPYVGAIHRRFARQLQCSGRHVTLQSPTTRRDNTSRILLLPCHDGSLFIAYELPYAVAHPLLRLEQAITDSYALDLSVALSRDLPGRLQYTYHLRPFHVVHALQPLAGTQQQTFKQACIMVDAVNEYFLVRDMVLRGWPGSTDDDYHGEHVSNAATDRAVVLQKYIAFDDVVTTLLMNEYTDAYTPDDCAEVLNIA